MWDIGKENRAIETESGTRFYSFSTNNEKPDADL